MGIFERAKNDIADEIAHKVVDEIEQREHPADGAFNLDEHREIESLVKLRLGARHVIICAELLDGSPLTYIPEEIGDKDLVYLIETLRDLRQMRLNE
jgi:hypothetical protein